LVVTMRVNGQTIEQVRLTGDAWERLVVAPPPQHRRFALADFDVAPPAGATLILVGKTEPR
jgi:hypothetical protein